MAFFPLPGATSYDKLNELSHDKPKIDYPKLIVSSWKEESIIIQKVKQCVNFSGSKPRTHLMFLAAFLAVQKKYGNDVWTY